MPRPEYYNLRRTDDRQARIEAIATKLGLDAEKPATWGIIIDIALGIACKELCKEQEIGMGSR